MWQYAKKNSSAVLYKYSLKEVEITYRAHYWNVHNSKVFWKLENFNRIIRDWNLPVRLSTISIAKNDRCIEGMRPLYL